jgi:hypothetical protein
MVSAATYTYLEAGPQTVQLAFDGTSISLTRIDGPYDVKDLWVSDLGLDADPMDLALNRLDQNDPDYSTAAYRAGDFETFGAVLTGQYSERGEDSDDDGRYDLLTMEVGLDISTPGTYTVVGDVHDRYGKFISQATWSGSASPATLQFGEMRGTTGPYTVRNLYLLNADDEIIDSRAEAYTTQQVIEVEGKTHIANQADFDELGAMAILPGPYSDSGVDTDGDGRFDELVITTALVVEPGEGGQAYRVEGWLVSANGALVAWSTSTPQVFSEGMHSVPLTFDGRMINQHGVDGPFKLVALKVLPGGTYQVIEEVDVAHTTQAYNHDQFEQGSPTANIFGDNMEEGTTQWTAQSPWSLSNKTSYSYSHAWRASASGSQTGSMTTSQLDLSDVEYANITVRFQTCYNMQSTNDVGYVEVKTNDTDWTRVATVSNSTSQWSRQNLDLGDLGDPTSLQLRFKANSQSGLLWYVDDVYIVGSPRVRYIYLPIIVK